MLHGILTQNHLCCIHDSRLSYEGSFELEMVVVVLMVSFLGSISMEYIC